MSTLLVIAGASLLVLAIALWTIMSRLQRIKNAISNGFLAMEDGISSNLLNPNAGIDITVKGLNLITGSLDVAKIDIQKGKGIIASDAVPVMREIATVLRNDVGNPVEAVGDIITDVGSKIDVHIAGATPLHDVAQPLKDAGGTLEDIGNKCIDIGNKVDDAANKATDLAQSLDSVSNKVEGISDNIKAVVPFVDNNFRNGMKKIVADLEKVRTQLNQVFGLVTPQFIALVAGVGVVLLGIGIALDP